MRKPWIVLGLLAACGGGPRPPAGAQGPSALEVRGAIKEKSVALGKADLARLPRHRVRGVDPVTGRSATWEGVSVAALLAERVTPAKGADTLVVRASDRTAVPIPITLVRQWKPVLADRADGTPLAVAVLAWPTLEQRGLETDPRAGGWWARDVVALEIADWRRAFAGALAPPDGVTDAARRGSSRFGDRCIRCHRLRGAGGERGPDLTTVAERLDAGSFADLLDRHPGWRTPGGDPPGPETVEELWSFLRAVAAAPRPARAEAPEKGRGGDGADDP